MSQCFSVWQDLPTNIVHEPESRTEDSVADACAVKKFLDHQTGGTGRRFSLSRVGRQAGDRWRFGFGQVGPAGADGTESVGFVSAALPIGIPKEVEHLCRVAVAARTARGRAGSLGRPARCETRLAGRPSVLPGCVCPAGPCWAEANPITCFVSVPARHQYPA